LLKRKNSAILYCMNAPGIIYSDKNFIVVNKPAGLLVHPVRSSAQANLEKKDEGGAGLRRSLMNEGRLIQTSNGVNDGGSVKEKTLVDFLLVNFPEIKSVGDPSTSSGQANLRPGIVHRLDRDTSGVMIIARNQKTFEELKKLFSGRKMEKTYLALVCGVPSKRKGAIETPVGRSIRNPAKRGTGRHIKSGREAITYYKVIKNYGKEFSFLEVMPRTGRTHQIRVHLKSIERPVACDRIYGGKNVCCPEFPAGSRRLFLHASSLEFSLPEGKRWKFEADLPEDLQIALDGLTPLEV